MKKLAYLNRLPIINQKMKKMKKISLLLMMSIATLMFVSCKKESATTTPTDPRDKFVGNWSGTMHFTIPTLAVDQTSNETHIIIKSNTNSNQILVDSIPANVNGNSYTYVQYTETYDDPTLGTVVYTLNGVGNLNGTNLTESGTLNMVAQGVSYPGSWSSNMVKQ